MSTLRGKKLREGGEKKKKARKRGLNAIKDSTAKKRGLRPVGVVGKRGIFENRNKGKTGGI